MKAGAFWLGLLVFAAATFAGYRLTAGSFAWVERPNFGSTQPVAASKGQIPAQLLQQAKSLSIQQLSCLRASISPDHLQAALQGHLTTQEQIAVNNCLK